MSDQAEVLQLELRKGCIPTLLRFLRGAEPVDVLIWREIWHGFRQA
jgi:hypothetical protein